MRADVNLRALFELAVGGPLNLCTAKERLRMICSRT